MHFIASLQRYRYGIRLAGMKRRRQGHKDDNGVARPRKRLN